MPQDAQLSVYDFEGTERLSNGYQFDLNITSSKSDIPAKELLLQPCSFELNIGEQKSVYHGIISKIQLIHQIEKD